MACRSDRHESGGGGLLIHSGAHRGSPVGFGRQTFTRTKSPLAASFHFVGTLQGNAAMADRICFASCCPNMSVSFSSASVQIQSDDSVRPHEAEAGRAVERAGGESFV